MARGEERTSSSCKVQHFSKFLIVTRFERETKSYFFSSRDEKYSFGVFAGRPYILFRYYFTRVRPSP